MGSNATTRNGSYSAAGTIPSNASQQINTNGAGIISAPSNIINNGNTEGGAPSQSNGGIKHAVVPQHHHHQMQYTFPLRPHGYSPMAPQSTYQAVRGKNVKQDDTPNVFRNMKLRRGKWTQQEESYAAFLIKEFEKGVISGIENGCTLRSFLSKKLHCAPMRISKKYAGTLPWDRNKHLAFINAPRFLPMLTSFFCPRNH